jgi:hypothetical protein
LSDRKLAFPAVIEAHRYSRARPGLLLLKLPATLIYEKFERVPQYFIFY